MNKIMENNKNEISFPVAVLALLAIIGFGFLISAGSNVSGVGQRDPTLGANKTNSPKGAAIKAPL